MGAALQKHRLQRGLTQAELAEFADLSLKYVGEIERGEANTTLEVLERLAAAVGWNPMDALEGLREPLSEGVRMLLLDEVQQILERLRNMTKWLQALDPALQPKPPRRRRSAPPPARTDEHRRLRRRAPVTQDAPRRGCVAAQASRASRLTGCGLEARAHRLADREVAILDLEVDLFELVDGVDQVIGEAVERDFALFGRAAVRVAHHAGRR